MKIPILLVIVLLILFYIIIPLLIWMRARNTKIGKTFVVVFSFLFGIILLIGITGKVSITSKFALVDMDFSAKWYNKTFNLNVFDFDMVDFIINIIMLIPVGLVIAYFSKSKVLNKILMFAIVGLIMGLMLESIQYIMPVYRSVQLSDVIFNSISVFIGGCLGMLYDLFLNKMNKRK